MQTSIFNLDIEQVREIAWQFSAELRFGLDKNESRLKCLPTYVPINFLPLSGEVSVLDLGGSNLRAATVILENNQLQQVQSTTKAKMPWQRGKTFPKSDLLRLQHNLLVEAGIKPDSLLGYCFSFPTDNTVQGDAQLIKWTKGICIPEMKNDIIGQGLATYLKEISDIYVKDVTVINDTVACLLAGTIETEADAYFGLIAGTGFNMAGLVPASEVASWIKQEAKVPSTAYLPVNFESGNFSPLHLTTFDHELDKKSENYQEQLFEKAVSGMYLSRLLKIACPELDMDRDAGTEAVMNYIDNSPDSSFEVETAKSLIRRAANLIAAQIWGAVLNYKANINPEAVHFCFACEGGFFWSSSNKLGKFSTLIRNTLENLQLLDDMPELKISLMQPKQANLVGSAIAALAKSANA